MSRKKEVVGEQFSNNFFAGDLVPTETPYGVVYSGPLGDEFLRKIPSTFTKSKNSIKSVAKQIESITLPKTQEFLTNTSI